MSSCYFHSSIMMQFCDTGMWSTMQWVELAVAFHRGSEFRGSSSAFKLYHCPGWFSISIPQCVRALDWAYVRSSQWQRSKGSQKLSACPHSPHSQWYGQGTFTHPSITKHGECCFQHGVSIDTKCKKEDILHQSILLNALESILKLWSSSLSGVDRSINTWKQYTTTVYSTH